MENQVKTAEELALLAEKIIASKDKSELSEAELEAIAGGGVRDGDGHLILASLDYICDNFEQAEYSKMKYCQGCRYNREGFLYYYCVQKSAPNFRRISTRWE
ncbi:MAG: hypothetical protein LBL98_06320 [Ruminococcus sp.]|jgi:hypothetical protein|nr:hypothetical protein [Ruminococcus sp.]